MNIESARYSDPNNSVIMVVADGVTLGVPVDAENRHYRMVQEWVNQGNRITPFEPVEPELPPLAKWRFETLIDKNKLRGPIEDAIAAMPEPQRTAAYNKRHYVPEFYSDDPLFAALTSMLGISREDFQAMWTEALNL